MENIKGITEHMRKKIIAAGGDSLRETLVEAFSEEHWRILENFIATESRSRVL